MRKINIEFSGKKIMKKIGEKSPQKIYGQLKIEFSGGQIVSKLQKTRKILKKNQKKNFENNSEKIFLGKPQKNLLQNL